MKFRGGYLLVYYLKPCGQFVVLYWQDTQNGSMIPVIIHSKYFPVSDSGYNHTHNIP